MRMPRVQITVRGIMVAVAVTGIALGILVEIVRLRRSSSAYAKRSADHTRLASLCRDQVERLKPGPDVLLRTWGCRRIPLGVPNDISNGNFENGYFKASPPLNDSAWDGAEATLMIPRSRAVWRRVSEHQASLAAKYERAARYPWLTVEPDPPVPE